MTRSFDQETRPLAPSERDGRSLRLRAGQLVVVDGPDRGRRFHFQPPAVSIGTHPDNDIVLTDDTVSKHHVRIEERTDGFVLIDSGSRNGTFVEGTRVKEVYLTSGASFRIGSTELRFDPPDAPVKLEASTRRTFGQLRGESLRTRELFGLLERIAPTDLSVLVLGETGTGKEVVAQSIHQESARAKGPCVVFDCSAVAKHLVESALFGHHEGAFTGATARRKGALLSAHGGTLFIDEIGELDLELQPKLLRALEKREVQPLGADRPQQVDVRVVAATHRDLRKLVADGQFRQDLFYRLSVMEVYVPPLRERREDIPVLVSHFLALAGAPDRVVSPGALKRLCAMQLPGNVRELKNLIDRALALAGSDAIDERHLIVSPGATAQPTPGERTLEAVEAEAILATLKKTGWNRTQAARVLGINRKTLIEKIQRYRLDPEDR